MSSLIPEPEAQSCLVVTGSSAGGIAPLSALVGGLPEGFPAPVVIAQHLAPGRESHLVEILQRQTSLSVRAVCAREALVPGVVYVVGPDHDVEIVDHEATAFALPRKGPKPSIDRLFTSAAATHGDRLIAIVFSGSGSDGLAGARTVKEHGGTVIVQEPASALYPSMPSAIPPTLIDIVARPEQMGNILAGLVSPDAGSRESSSSLRVLLGQLRERTGVDFGQYKTATIMRRLSRLMLASGVSSVGEYMRYLQTHPEGYQRLVSAFLIKVTEFFRDAALFDELRSTILPSLFEQARSRDRELRIWSAGTSTGEEAYSLAILCAELLRSEDTGISVRIFATDLDEEAIAFARRGVYSADSLKHLPQPWIERYFVRVGDVYEVGKRIRNMTVFGQHDLGQRAPFPRIDLCLCRNVLIYFTRELQTRALQLFAFSLRDGGYLILGKAESLTPAAEAFDLVDAGLKILRRRGDRVVLPPARLQERISAGEAPASPASLATGNPLLRPAEGRPAPSELNAAFLTSSPVGVVVVDRRYDIISINASARALLEIHGVGIGEDLIHLARTVDAVALRALIDAAVRGDVPPFEELRVLDPAGGVARWLRAYALCERVDSAAAGSTALLFVDVTASTARRLELEELTTGQSQTIDDLRVRIEEMSRRQKALLQANVELTRANDELRGNNEQLLIQAEEAASASEEVETLNEEMQATNEEFETLNEELQATVEELNTTNDELEARGAELVRAADLRERILDEAEAKVAALQHALSGALGPFALVSESGRLLFSVPEIKGIEVLDQRADWWRETTMLQLGDGRRWRTVPRRLPSGESLVTFSVADAS